MSIIYVYNIISHISLIVTETIEKKTPGISFKRKWSQIRVSFSTIKPWQNHEK